MSKTHGDWKRSDTKSLVWLAVHAAGTQGAKKAALMDQMSLSATAMEWHLENMMRDQYVVRSGWGHYCSGERVPPIEGYALQRAIELLDDCPQGVSLTVLCDELQLGAAALFALLEPAEQAGQVQRIVMPRQHGGVGWQLVAGQDVADAALQTLPVYEVDIDRIHRVQRPDLFKAELVDGRLAITSGAQSVTLPAEHTQRLLMTLAPHILRLACHD